MIDLLHGIFPGVFPPAAEAGIGVAVGVYGCYLLLAWMALSYVMLRLDDLRRERRAE